jgi:hypothetical protein
MKTSRISRLHQHVSGAYVELYYAASALEEEREAFGKEDYEAIEKELARITQEVSEFGEWIVEMRRKR